MFLHDKEKSQSKDPTKNIVTNTTTDIVNISSLGAPKYCKRTIIAVLIILYFSFEQPKCVGNLAKCGSETLFKIKQATLYDQSINLFNLNKQFSFITIYSYANISG